LPKQRKQQQNREPLIRMAMPRRVGNDAAN